MSDARGGGRLATRVPPTLPVGVLFFVLAVLVMRGVDAFSKTVEVSAFSFRHMYGLRVIRSGEFLKLVFIGN